jgi:hypothetical protein
VRSCTGRGGDSPEVDWRSQRPGRHSSRATSHLERADREEEALRFYQPSSALSDVERRFQTKAQELELEYGLSVEVIKCVAYICSFGLC